jgi:hypothetical protein
MPIRMGIPVRFYCDGESPVNLAMKWGTEDSRIHSLEIVIGVFIFCFAYEA